MAAVVAVGVKHKWIKPYQVHLLAPVHSVLPLSRAAANIHSLELTYTTWHFSTFNITVEADFPVCNFVPL